MYSPADDDRPESTPSVPTQLSLAQQLLLKQYEEQVQRLSAKECQDLAYEIARQMLVKVCVLVGIHKGGILVCALLGREYGANMSRLHVAFARCVLCAGFVLTCVL